MTPTAYHLAAHETLLSVLEQHVLVGAESLPSALVVDENGDGFPLATTFDGPGDKEAFAKQIRDEVTKRAAICAGFTSEAWMTQSPIDAPDLTLPSQSANRIEVIMCHSEGRDGVILDTIMRILRDHEGKATGFEKVLKTRSKRGDLGVAEGDRFSGFFPADA